ncbi:MAG: 2-C-methyl-D-erythritol 4-phosphate cytidylyltransferase [Clostridiales bacterium]|jgi:2-C-methyl-D-erythritol 4-phosphate cytidylyltransferase|nr:2-C-methyl-D-erythritol 4-phosphate cytidylyltransferase [Clostridiales bacterium]
MKNIALLLAGGSGSRIQAAGIPKQYIPVAGKPIIIHTLSVFEQHPEIGIIAVVCAADYAAEMRRLAAHFHIGKMQTVIPGGQTRQESAYNGLCALRAFADSGDIVLMHDAARPLVSGQMITENITLAKQHGGVTTATPSADTMLRSDDGKTVSAVLARGDLFAVQTPQSFLFEKILAAHEAAKNNAADFTDDGGLYMQYTNAPLAIAAGSRLNFKITTDADLALFRAIADTNSK